MPMNTQGKHNWNPMALAMLGAGVKRLLLSAGCKSDEPPLVFNDASTLPSLPANTMPSRTNWLI